MTIAHHPPDDLLLGYASGAADEATALVLATHLALCPACRRTVAQAEAIGGMLLEDAGETPVASGAMRSVLSRLDEPATPERAARSSSSIVPQPLLSYIGADFEAVAWKKISRGVFYAPLFRRGSAQAYLLRSAPGRGVGSRHTHYGEELTLCLTGGYSDETGRYARGDLQCATPDLLHETVADAGEDCITLAMRDARLKFSNPIVGLIGRWFGF